MSRDARADVDAFCCSGNAVKARFQSESEPSSSSPLGYLMMCQLGQKCVMEVVLLTILSWMSVWAEEKIIFDRHAVYWNSSNPK